MRQKLLSEAAAFLLKNRRRRMWAKAVSCMAAVVVFCTTYVLILPALTMEKDTVCGYEEHIHTEECYKNGTTDVSGGNNWQVVSNGDVSDGDEGTYCGKHAHTHTTECFGDSDTTADVETEEEWKASFANLTLTGNWAQDVVAIGQSQVGYKESEANFFYNTEEKKLNGYTRYGAWYGDEYGDWNAMFVAFCLNYAQVTDYPVDADCAEWVELLSQEEYDLYRKADEYTPAAGDLIFFDTAKDDGIANYVGIVEEVAASEDGAAQLTVIVGDSSDEVKRVSYKANDASILGYGMLPYQLTAEEQAQVDYVIGLIDEMPSADEIDTKIEEFEDAEDYDGEEAWLTEVYQQVAEAYYYYDLLNETQKSRVTNADKLLELEYIWSVTVYTATSGTSPIDTAPIYQVNSYTKQNGSEDSVLIYGGSYDEIVGGNEQFKNNWVAIVVGVDSNGNLYVENYVSGSSDKSALKPTDTTRGFVLLFYYTGSYFDFVSSYNAKTKIYASVDFDYTKTGIGGYNSAGYGTISLDKYVFVKKTATESDPPGVVPSAHTSDFVELNLYDYGSNINKNYFDNQYKYTDWNKVSKSTSYYPGFQWNGGAYKKADNFVNGLLDRNKVDSIDFGNSLITDFKYSGSGNGKSSTATDITLFADSGTYNINAMDFYNNNTNIYGVNNRPIGISLDPNSDTYEVLSRTLGSDGYPQLKANNASLAYLFTDNAYATKQNTSSIDGLFQYNATTGMYSYNSRENHAQYSNNTFTLYKQIITPNFIVYPFGNFMPFNDITDSETSTQVSKITSMSNYVDYMMNQLYAFTKTSYNAGYDSSRAQLYNMLQMYKDNVNYYKINGKTWGTFGAKDAIIDYFMGDSNGDNPSNDVAFATDAFLSTLYNIDFDVEKNFFFGMEMKMDFYQPRDGMTGVDDGNDGDFDYPMVFGFTGDDDVWVYIDDVLFLDLSGIHRHVGGKIDFVNGKVYYYALNTSKGDVVVDLETTDRGTPYAEYTFKDLLTAAGKNPDEYLKKNAAGNYTTFKDYTTHSFQFYYIERGSGSSVCRMNFNFPLMKQHSITVEKELADDNTTAAVEALGNPDFMFQVLAADPKTDKDGNTILEYESYFEKYDEIGSDWAYSLYDVDGTPIQEVRIISRNLDGSVDELNVYQGDVLVRTEKGGKITYENTDQKPLTIDENGCFTLKAGQKAEFVGIPEEWGEYFVRELLPADLETQYGEVSISGTTASRVENVVIGESSFIGQDSPAHDTHISGAFKYTNKITTSKLGKLSIKKIMSNGKKPDTVFKFQVTLDGKPLPENTEYTVDGQTKKVLVDKTGNAVTASYVEISAGETAVISNIIAGTEFEVTEVAVSGYTATYAGGNTSQGAASATGTIGVDTVVAVTVTNSEDGTSIEIPIRKEMYSYSDYKRTFTFRLQEVESLEKPLSTMGEATEIKIENVSTEAKENKFTRSYTQSDIPSGVDEKKFYYTIVEVPSGETGVSFDPTTYLVEVNVTKQMVASITKVWTVDENGNTTPLTTNANPTLTFTNTIVRNLTIKKVVSGTDEDKSKEFKFVIELSEGESKAPVPTDVIGILTDKDNPNGKSGTYSFENGRLEITLRDGQSLQLTGLPWKSNWKVTEKDADGYLVSYKVGEGDSVSGTTVSGTADDANASIVEFTNTRLYELPETGGTGTTSYTTAGLMLILCSAAYLMYIRAKKRKEVSWPPC